MDNKMFLGTGIHFPPGVNPGTGRFLTSTAEQSVKESVYLILMTQRGERWLLPDFGSDLMSYTFMDTSATMLNLLANDLRTTLLEQEPRISDVDVGYLVSETNSRDNLVFPFYLNAGAAGEGSDGNES